MTGADGIGSGIGIGIGRKMGFDAWDACDCGGGGLG